MSISATVTDDLAAHRVEYELVPHPRTYTSHDTAESAHVREDHIAKAVVVRDHQGFAMVVIPASEWLKLHALQEETGREYVLAYEPEIDELFGDCQPGAIPPLGVAYGIETFVDERLTSLANIYFEAGDHQNLVHIDGESFHRLLKGARHGNFSHDRED